MRADLLASLRCPACHEPFTFAAAPRAGTDGAFGVLSCPDHNYPVIDGIPILRSGRVSVQDHMSGREEVPGPTVAELVAMVRGADPAEALVRLLSFPPALPLHLERVPVLRLPLTRGPGARLGMARRTAEVRRAVADSDGGSAQDWLRRSYLRSRNVSAEFYPYFLHRFAQPRYLSTLTLLRALPASENASDKPILDLACGFGHVLFHLAAREHPVAAVGVDRNFFQLWVASRFVAPTQAFVCADAADPLPFADDTFAASVCTDAFHLFDDRPFALAELRRCAEQRTVFLDRVGNGLLEPHDVPNEPDLDGYRTLIGDAPFRMVDETALVADYRAARGPRLAVQPTDDILRTRKWLSILTRAGEDLFVDHQPFDRPPHADGPLAVNPVYHRSQSGDTVRLSFGFPSPWFAFENGGMTEYHADSVTLDVADIERLDEARVRELVDRFVLLALPPRYLG